MILPRQTFDPLFFFFFRFLMPCSYVFLNILLRKLLIPYKQPAFPVQSHLKTRTIVLRPQRMRIQMQSV